MQWQNAGAVITLPNGTCECGVPAGNAGSDCVSLRDALLARDFEQPVTFWRYHRLAVDAYCLQHAAHVKSARSFAAHIGGMCIALEHGNSQPIHEALIRWLNSPTCDVVKPEIPDARGELTIAHVSGIEDPAAYGRAVEQWARSVWIAYVACQPIAREWARRAATLRTNKR